MRFTGGWCGRSPEDKRERDRDQEATAWGAFWNLGGMMFIQQSDVVDLCLKRIIYNFKNCLWEWAQGGRRPGVAAWSSVARVAAGGAKWRILGTVWRYCWQDFLRDLIWFVMSFTHVRRIMPYSHYAH